MIGQKVLCERWIYDLKKPKIDKYQRAKIIKDYMSLNNLSIRAFGEKFNINKSTIEDWLLWNKLNPVEVAELKELGYTDTDVYRFLRNNKERDTKELTDIDLIMDKAILKLSSAQAKNRISIHTKEKLEQLKKAVSTFEFRISKVKI